MASPSMTQNAAGNLVSAGAGIAASGTSTPVTVDATGKFEVQLQFDVLTGNPAQAGGTYTVSVYRLFGAGPTSDTVPITQMQVMMGNTSTHFIASLALPTGRYSVTITNNSTYPVTFAMTSSSIDSIA